MSVSKPSFRENKPGWYACHRSHVNSVIRRQAKVILLGDSIMASLSRYPCVWDRHLQPFNTVNCGVGGDRTQHVLWRAENMYLPASVSVAVILCGTNNMDYNVYLPHDIAHSVLSCGTRLRDKHPHLKVIVVGILPRDRTISKRRIKIQQTNDILKKVCWKEGFLYIEQACHWTTSSGELNRSLYWKDNLHLNRKGCNVLAKQISDAINLSPPPTTSSHPSPPSPSPYGILHCRVRSCSSHAILN